MRLWCYHRKGVKVPVSFHLVAKTEKYTDRKTQTEKRRRPVSKNAVCQDIIKQAVTNLIPFRFVLFDVWFASAETLVFIKQEQKRDVICPLKTNRKVTLSLADKQQGRYVRVDTLELEAQATREIYLEGVPLADKEIDPDANRERAQELRNRFIGEKDPASLIENSRLFLNETDNPFYQDYLVQLRTPLNPRGLPKSNRLLWDCFRPAIAPDRWTLELLDARQRQLAARAVHLWRADFA